MDGTTALVPAFRYADVPDADRDWLRRRAEDVVGLTYRAVCDHVRVGLVLTEARGRLRGRVFRRWVAAELPFSRAWAYKLMALARAFGDHVQPGRVEQPPQRQEPLQGQ